MILLISGLQGVGKTTIIHELLKIKTNYKLSISSTTRPKRSQEMNEYEFLTLEEFNEKEQNDYFLEVVNFNGFKYGTPKHQLDHQVILNVNPSSILNFQKLLKSYNYISIFIDSPEEILKDRLIKRDGINIEDKIKKWLEEKPYKKYFDHIIENINLEEAINKILYFI